MSGPALTGRRILFVAPRLHRSIVGGGDQYTLALAWELERAGADVRILTTRTLDFESRAEFGIGWPDDLPAGEKSIEGLVVRRFGVWSPPRAWAGRASRWVRARLDREAAGAARGSGHAWFADGWYEPEPWDGDLTARWSARRSCLALPSAPTTGLSLTAFSPKPQRIRVIGIQDTARTDLGAVDLPGGAWTTCSRCWPSQALDALELVGDHDFVPGPQDRRSLSFAISALEIRGPNGASAAVGLERKAADHIDALDDDGFARTWIPIASSRPRRYGWAYAILRGPVSPGLAVACVREARRADAIVASGFPFLTSSLAILAGRVCGRPVYLLPFFHDRDLTHHWHHLYTALRHARGTLTLSEWQNELLPRTFGARSVHIGASSPHWSMGGTLPDVPSPGSRPSTDVGEHSGGARTLAKKPFRLVFVGRLTPSKGVATAADAVRSLRADGLDARLLVVGPAEASSEPAAETGDPNAVQLLGALGWQELQSLLAASDALVLPSRHESFGLVVLEAWAVERPVLVERASGSLRTLVENGVDGYVCATEREYAESIRTWMENRDLWRAMGRAGRAKLTRRFTWDRVLARLASELAGDRLAADRSPARS